MKTMNRERSENICAVGAVIADGRQWCGLTVKEFCREANISLQSYYRLMHKKRQSR